MGKKKKALLRNKRLGNLGKYATKFSALLRTKKTENKVEDIEDSIQEDKADESLNNIEETPEPAKKEPKPAKPRSTTKRKTPAKKKTTTTTRRRRTTKTKTAD